MSFATALARLSSLENPYPGLRPFEPSESNLFFGRDLQVLELEERLRQKRFLAVVGVSGSGKSSLVRAGLIPSLQRGIQRRNAVAALRDLSTSESVAILAADVRDDRLKEHGKQRPWEVVITRPSGAPYAELATQLGGVTSAVLRKSSQTLIEYSKRLKAGENLLLVVDQFEELFRYKDEQSVAESDRHRLQAMADEAADFVQLLIATHRDSAQISIVLTMRSDYLGDCAEFRDLPETLNDCQYLIPRLTREQRKLAIEGPLGKVKISPSLVQVMLNDAGDEPDQLPVLQHALMRTWDNWLADGAQDSRAMDERPIEEKHYEAIGGFDHALDHHAAQLLAEPVAQVAAPYALEAPGPQGEKTPATIAEVIFKRLIARGRNNRERRDPAQLSELWELCGAKTAEQKAQVVAVIDLFRGKRASLLAPREGELTADTYIDITHESLIRKWRKLAEEWGPEEVKSSRTFLRLIERTSGELLAGLDLADAVAWRNHRNNTLRWATHYANETALTDVLEFIKKSEKAERKKEAKRHWAFWTSVGLGVVFTALAGLAIYEFEKQHQTQLKLIVALENAHESENNAKEQTSQAVAATQKFETALSSLTSEKVELLKQADALKMEEHELDDAKAAQRKAEDESDALRLQIAQKNVDEFNDRQVLVASTTAAAVQAGTNPVPASPPGSSASCSSLLAMNFRSAHISLLTNEDVQNVATSINVPKAALVAFLKTESVGVGFTADGRPPILFERHIFSRLTGGIYDQTHPNISNPAAGGYGLSSIQYARLTEAAQLNCDAALQAASWGLLQELGNNYQASGFTDVSGFVKAQMTSELDQLTSLLHWLQSSGALSALQTGDWEALANRYNGPGAAQNGYGVRLSTAYEAELTDATDFDVRAAQFQLTKLGLYSGAANGAIGPITVDAIKKFQLSKGLKADGVLNAPTKQLLLGAI